MKLIMKIGLILAILPISLVPMTMLFANVNASSEQNDSCYDAGYNDGQNNPFNHDTYDDCADEDGGDRVYYDGFIDGCMDADNSRDVCEQATDAE
jgi:hypothetical protein